MDFCSGWKSARIRPRLAQQQLTSPKALNDFKAVLAQMEKHASERYFVLSADCSPICYGVDIMKDEICKLRGFSAGCAVGALRADRAAARIDFNIRPGNTLVGFSLIRSSAR